MNLLTLIAFCVNVVFVCFVLFFERKESSKRGLWLFILVFIPIAGIVIYILGSGHFFTGTYRMRLTNELVSSLKNNSIESQNEFILKNKTKIKNPIIKENISLVNMNLHRAKSLIASACDVKIFVDGKEIFEKMLDDIKSAKKTIYMEYFIFKNDKVGKRFMDVLIEKARSGVEVKLMFDDLGSRFTPMSFFKKLKKAGGKFHSFFQLRLGLPLTINYRNHRKITVVDEKIAWTGGINIADEYCNESRSCKLNWRDTAVRVKGEICENMNSLFISDWYSATAWKKRKRKIMKKVNDFFPPHIFNKINGSITKSNPSLDYLLEKNSPLVPCQIVTSDPNGTNEAKIEDTLMRIINSAKNYVYIQTPYFTPDDAFIACLKIAAFNGVDVRIQLPRDWDKFYVKAASFQFVRELQNSGIKFYLYPGFIHSKTITCDDKILSIGSTNIDCRSFNLHFENNLFFYDDKLSVEHKKIFLNDEKISHLVENGEFDKKNIFLRAWWSFAKLFAPLM